MSEMNLQLAEALMTVANQLSGTKPQKTYQKRKKTVLTLTHLLDDGVNKKALMDSYTWRNAHNAKAAMTKHTISATGNAVSPPLNEDSFFIDCTLDRTVVNATFGTGESLLSALPARGSIFRDKKFAFITGIDDSDDTGNQENPCDEAPKVNDGISACKIDLPLGRRQRANQTGEIDVIIQEACQGIYRDFVFIGDIRGSNAILDLEFTPNDRSLIVDGAILKSMKMVGRNFAKWMCLMLWTGDPANNTGGGGYKEPLGLLRLITGDYPVDLAGFLEGTNCDALNSDVKDFASECIGGGVNSIWNFMLEADHTIMLRENLYGLQRDDVILVMHPIMLRAFYETVPCEMAGQGCNGADVSPNDGGNGLFNLDEQNRIRNERTVTLNGTTYRIILDSCIPITETAVTGGFEYESTIFGIPLVVSGEEVLYIDYNDYTNYMQALEPVDELWNESTGWTDGGKYFHTIERKQTCFDVTTKVEPRVIFTAPHLTWRIDNVKACYIQQKPQADLGGLIP